MTISFPTKERATRSLLVAPLFPVGILFVLDAVDRAVQFGILYIFGAAILAAYMLIVVEIFSVLLGGAILAILWDRIPFNVLVCALVGGLIAAVPFVMFGITSASQEPINYDAWIEGQATVVSGVKTTYGRLRDVVALVQIFGLGTIGGSFFWWLCRPKSAEADIE